MRKFALSGTLAAAVATHATPACASTLLGGFTGSFLLTFFFFVGLVAVAQFVHWFLPLLRGKKPAPAGESREREAAEG
jgi:predicted exporter